MKNIKKLTGYKGNDMLELIDRLHRLELNRTRELIFIDFLVEVKPDWGDGWYFDPSNIRNEFVVHNSHNSKSHDGYDWKDEVSKHLFELDSVTGYKWVEFAVNARRTRNLYAITVHLRRA